MKQLIKLIKNEKKKLENLRKAMPNWAIGFLWFSFQNLVCKTIFEIMKICLVC